MYFDDAINRINRIEWKKSEDVMENAEKDLGYEYLRKMAEFVNEQELKPNVNPLLVNVASVLGDKSVMNYVEQCSSEVQESLTNNVLPKHILNFYLQLAHYADYNTEAERYLQIYEPLIQLLERGFLFAFKERGFMVYNVAFYPLCGWYERFLNKKPETT